MSFVSAMSLVSVMGPAAAPGVVVPAVAVVGMGRDGPLPPYAFIFVIAA